MIFTGKNLELVEYALELALAELHTQVATCPDHIGHAELIDEIEQEQQQLQRLLSRVERAVEKSQPGGGAKTC